MKTESIVLAKRPEGIPSDDVFRYETIEIDEPGNDEIQVEAIYISVDPYMRGRMDDSKSYIQPFQLDEPLAGHIVGKVIQSNADGFEQGDYVVGMLPWQKHTNVSAQSVTKITQRDIPLYLYLSVLGMTGQTA